MRPLECSFRRFKHYIAGLTDGAFASAMQAEADEDEEWRRELAEKSGREYVPRSERRTMTLDEFVASGESI